jgi:hypothetical protein
MMHHRSLCVLGRRRRVGRARANAAHKYPHKSLDERVREKEAVLP